MSSKSKTIIIIFILIAVAAAGSYKYFSRTKELPYDFAYVERGDVVQLVSATGEVVPQKKIDLQFEIQGKIKQIKVEVGEQVNSYQVLAVLDTVELNIKVLEAAAARDVSQADLEKILAGASQEEIKVYETAVENAEIALQNAQISLENAEQNLTDVEATAEENLNQDYGDALNTLEDSYLKLYNAFNTVDSIQTNYFTGSDQESIKVKGGKEAIEEVMNRAKSYLDVAKDNPTNENIDVALSEMKDALNSTSQNLAVVREMCDEPIYRNAVSSANKTSLDTQKSNVITALTNIVNSQQTISSTGLTNQLDTNTAQSSLDTAQNTLNTAEGDLKTAEDKLAQIKASPREHDVDLAQAKLAQAEAVLAETRQNLAKASLTAPLNGIVTDIKKEEGETATIQEAIVSIIGLDNFQIEVDISEINIGKVNLRDSAEITLDAFPDYKFLGKVIDIEPAETIIQGVVYYRVTAGFEEAKEGIKSGMTANVDIITDLREDVLRIPQRAVLTKNGQKIVRVLEGEEIKEVQVETGIRGNEGEIEILSGIKEGDKIITFVKKK